MMAVANHGQRSCIALSGFNDTRSMIDIFEQAGFRAVAQLHILTYRVFRLAGHTIQKIFYWHFQLLHVQYPKLTQIAIWPNRVS